MSGPNLLVPASFNLIHTLRTHLKISHTKAATPRLTIEQSAVSRDTGRTFARHRARCANPALQARGPTRTKIPSLLLILVGSHFDQPSSSSTCHLLLAPSSLNSSVPFLFAHTKTQQTHTHICHLSSRTRSFEPHCQWRWSGLLERPNVDTQTKIITLEYK